jgi:hypothetical protein
LCIFRNTENGEMSGSSTDDLLFEVATPMGFTVRVSHAYWEVIVTIKHPVMAGCEEIVRDVLARPEEVRISRSDNAVYLFYGRERERRRVCAVAKRVADEGFLITAYPTDAVKEGVRVWPT